MLSLPKVKKAGKSGLVHVMTLADIYFNFNSIQKMGALMKYVELGKTGEKVPAIGFGTWKLGNDGIDAIKKSIELGANFIDTAEMYGNEAIVGRAIKGADAFIATKVSAHHLHYDDVIKACKNSIRLLGVKKIDLYQIHWPNPAIPIQETMRAMEKLVDEGLVRHIGVSNFSLGELKEAQSAMSKYEIASNQVEYNIMVRGIEEDLLPFCKKEKITVIAYSPLARGAVFREKKVYGLLNELAGKYGRSIAQISLNYLIANGGVVAIPKASGIPHVEENVGAADFTISKEDLAKIRRFL